MGQIKPHYPVEFYPMDPNKYGTNYTISLVILPHGSKQEFNSPRYTTFNKVYQTRWRDVLRFRDKSLFTLCEVCQTLTADLSDKGLSFEQYWEPFSFTGHTFTISFAIVLYVGGSNLKVLTLQLTF